jgi:hypothetical protein
MRIDHSESLPHWLRCLALGLSLVTGIEWCQPLMVLAQPNGSSTANVSSNELPPIQEAEKVEVRSPFYKKWWFWTIVAAVVGGAAIAVAAGGGGNGGSAPAPGSVNAKW